MLQTLVALAPVLIVAVWRYGTLAALPLVAAVVAAWFADAVCDARRCLDGTAVVTGAIFACLLPAGTPWWIAAAGGVIAIVLGKHLFGGLGANPFNPAALARAVLMGLVPTYFFAPSWTTVDGLTTATPLAKEIGSLQPTLGDLFMGIHPGTLGEASPIALIAGGLILLSLRTIDWRVPLCYLASISLLAMVLPPGDRLAGHAPWLLGNPLAHLLGGGSLFAAFFMLTDPVTSPFSAAGRVVFAVLAAVFTMVVRFYTPYPDGVAVAVLLANALVPTIDRWMSGSGARLVDI
jgi:electron transport complex protein RnfD